MYAQNYSAQEKTLAGKLVLFIGQAEKGEALAAQVETLGGYVYRPQALLEALGMYITYMPQVVVLDLTESYAQEAFQHLRSVDARPLVLLTYRPAREPGVYTLPPHISAEALADALAHFAELRPVPNGLYQYA